MVPHPTDTAEVESRMAEIERSGRFDLDLGAAALYLGA
jgi:hypothetical protein